MGDKNRGLYQKFFVERTDGSSAPGGKHDGCDYFVLDLDHDKHALAAIAAYAASCELEYPLLAAELRAMLSLRKWTGCDAVSVAAQATLE